MERQESRTVTTEVKIVLTEEDIIEILRAHVGLYEGLVDFIISDAGWFNSAEITETHTVVESTP